MTKRYQRELDALPAVYAAAMSFDVSKIAAMIATTIHHPLLAVGSGGSFSTASFAADLHLRRTGQLARAATPFELVSGEIPQQTAIICFSASGRNRDIGVAYKLAAQEESGPVGALVLSDDTPLHSLQRRYGYTEVTGHSHETFRDGFLAVASMIASSILLTRAYDQALGELELLPQSYSDFLAISLAAVAPDAIHELVSPSVQRSAVSMLYSPIVRSAAVDLESRFVEAALGSIHTSDFRNFGHGRHHWMAKRADETGLLAIVSDRDKVLADRTLALIPDEIPSARIDLEGPSDAQAVAGLIAGLYISRSAGHAAKIDPGKPGVPLFGRKLYGLGPGAIRVKTSTANKRAAIKRKAPDALRDEQQYHVWSKAHDDVVATLLEAKIGGIVFDYDGTLCDRRHRFDPLQPVVCDALTHALDNGMKIGIATGRGASAGKSMRQTLPERVWDDILMGYYNGALIASLREDADPMLAPFPSSDFIQALQQHPVLKRAELKSNEAQISMRLPSFVSVTSAISAVDSCLSAHGLSARIASSSHSIDILFTTSSKTAVIDEIEGRLQEGLQVLRVGDRGVWPGNDAELLDSPYGLSVDETSRHFDHCWALAPAGVKGVQATLYYLSKLDYVSDVGRLRIQPGDRGDVYAS